MNVWALNDLAGQILYDPKHLLDGRIHYPYPHTLAFVDHQIANALLALPFVASGRDPIVIYNIVFLATFWLSGMFCYLLVRDLTDSVAAGLVAGSIFAFSTYRFNHVVHLHLLGTQWLPLALLALHRFLARPSWLRLIGVVGSGCSWRSLLGSSESSAPWASALPLSRQCWPMGALCCDEPEHSFSARP